MATAEKKEKSEVAKQEWSVCQPVDVVPPLRSENPLICQTFMTQTQSIPNKYESNVYTIQ